MCHVRDVPHGHQQGDKLTREGVLSIIMYTTIKNAAKRIGAPNIKQTNRSNNAHNSAIADEITVNGIKR